MKDFRKRLESGEIISVERGNLHIVYEVVGLAFIATVSDEFSLRRISDVNFENWIDKIVDRIGKVYFK